VTGSSWPVPSEIQLTSTGTEMTAEEHVATAETHLQYAEGHLQPSEEHLADAEVHLKLVRAHLAALVAMESAETDPPETAILPPPAPESGKASAGRTGGRPLRRGTGVQLQDPGRGLRSGGASPTARRSARERGSAGCVLSASVRTRQPTPWMNVESSRTYQSPKGGR
jgi:hypothetical protein